MHEPQMTPFEARLASRLRSHSAIDVAPANALAIARAAMTTPRRSGIAAAWSSLRMPVRLAIGVALLSASLLAALLVGSRLLLDSPTVVRPPVASPAPTAVALAGPAGEELRSRWLAFVEAIPGIGNGSGPITLTIDPTGGVLSLANLAPGASFSSRVETVGTDTLLLELISASGGCAPGAEGHYRMASSPQRDRLTLEVVSEACATRGSALARAWDRTLVGPSIVGAGIVDAFEPAFKIHLPDDTYEARILDGFVEIASPTGIALLVFKNPQGFADSCSTDEVRSPYVPGAAAFVDWYRQNDAFVVVDETPLQIDGHDAIHLVVKVKVEGARCPGSDLYAWTPKDCECHFFGADDSIYLVEVGSDTIMFILSPTPDAATELSIIRTIRIPYSP